jgi:hypothetical protein
MMPTPQMIAAKIWNCVFYEIELILNKIKEVTRTAMLATNVNVLREATNSSRL